MLEASQPWNLFGYDVRRALHYVRAGWRDFLWDDSSVVLGAVDEVVAARQPSGDTVYFRAGKPVAAPTVASEVKARAVILPDDLILCRTLRVPAAAEPDLESMLALEVTTSSPFPREDTCHGWLVVDRPGNEIVVQLVITSKSAVMAHIARELDSHDVMANEVWAQVADRVILITGFGESPRLSRNRHRLGRMAAIVAYCVLALMLLVALAAGAKYLELQQVRATESEIASAATDAVALRSSLSSAKSMIATLNEMLAAYPSPLLEIRRLSAILDDDTWLGSADVQGAQIKIEGESKDASAVMQQLLDHPAYSRVEAPVAIRKVGPRSERFVLKLTLADQEPAE